ncbi:PREDICTED: uncharacterized protein LOC105148395 [Acromyrmex echinatior]|uniref:uncharacterized protein LOC105148395 n=1 Tax=Acromyrmex echinatior TaxID=103372 RepID=UPI000580CE2A|nr:PREDICTED: uncharacterized protein LOC105148395 [Acromyrmex echinatior]
MSMTSMKPCYCQYISITRTAIMESSSRYLNVHHKSEPYNQNYENDLRNNLQLNVWIMKIIGTWPLTHSSIEMLWYRVLNVICYILLALLLIPSGIYIVLEIKDFYNQLKLGSALTFFFMAVLKYCALLLRENDIRKCVDYIKSDWRNVRYTDERRIMLQNANFGRRLVVICSVLMYGGVTFYFVAVPLTRAKIKEEDTNLTYRRLVFPVPSVIVDARRSPVNEIFYFIQLFAGFIAHNITVAACSLAALLAMHARGQLQVLMSWINHLVDGREGVNDTTNERLAKIIQLHMRILNFISLTEELLHEISLVEVVGCTLNICFLGYYCMMEWDFKKPVSGLTYLILLTSLTFNIFIFCYIGELVTEQIIKVRESSYMIDWYRLPERKSLAIILIICMSNATTRLTAGNMIELSISSFGDVIKSSVAYLNMLRTKLSIMERTSSIATIHDHEKDVQLSIQLNRWILKPIGVWPKLTEISRMERYAYGLVNVICTSLIGFLFIPSVIFMLLEMDDAYRKRLEKKNTLHSNDRIIMIRNAKFGRRLVSICAFFMYGGAVFYYLALPFSKGKITESDGNLTYRPLVYPVASVILDARHSPISEILFWIQCLSGFIAHSITAGACSLAAVFAMHAYGRLEVLIQWIEHLVDGREDFCNNVDERLAMIVQQHVRILHFISLTDKVLREISIVEIVGCTLNMCFLGYYSLTEWETKETTSYITYIVLLISLTFNIFIFCYIGELVAEKCKKIGEVSYMIDWHRLSERKSLALVLIIAMSNSSIKLTAGNLFELSLSTFGDVSNAMSISISIYREIIYVSFIQPIGG